MADKKFKRRVVGSVVKSKPNEDGTVGPDYIKMREDVALRKGETLRLESKKSQLEGLQTAVKAGKLTGEYAEKAMERINNIPDFVRFEIVRVTSE